MVAATLRPPEGNQGIATKPPPSPASSALLLVHSSSLVRVG